MRNSVDFTVKWEEFKGLPVRHTPDRTTIKNEVISLGGKRIASGDIGAGKSIADDRRRKPIKIFLWLQRDRHLPERADQEYNERAAAATGNSGQQYQKQRKSRRPDMNVDGDADGYITANDRKDLGSPLPVVGGLGISASWKGFMDLYRLPRQLETRYSMPSR